MSTKPKLGTKKKSNFFCVRIESSARPLFPQWSHHVYPQFLPGSHPNYQNRNIHNAHHYEYSEKQHCHSNNLNMTTPPTPNTTPTTINLSQNVIINSSNVQQSHHLHNHYHLQNNSHHLQHQPNQQRNHTHLNNVNATTATPNYAHIRNRNTSALHKNNVLNNNYPYRNNTGIVCTAIKNQ